MSLMLEDKMLILKCRRGNKEAMCRIYGKYKNYLLTLARGLVGEQQTAEDIVHDVFVNFAKSAGKFQLTGSFKGYLATCVGNLARDTIRSRVRQNKALKSIESLKSNSGNPEQHAIESEELLQLRQAIHRIPYEQREAVILHLKGGMKFREIARLRGVSVSTIHGRYRYGLEKLRSLFNGEAKK